LNARRAAGMFAAGALAGLATLVVLTRQVLAQERAQRAAEVERDHHEDLRAALTTMDMRLTPLLARGMGRLDAQVETPAAPEPRVTRLDLASGQAGPGAPLDEAFACELSELAASAFGAELDPGAQRLPRAPGDDAWRESRGAARSDWAYDNRHGSNSLLNGVLPIGAGRVAGPLVPRWEPGPGPPRLVFARNVRTADVIDELHVYRVDWPAVSADLLASIVELFPDARLEPVRDEGDADVTQRLASVPARLVVPPPAAPRGVARTTAAILTSVWVAALAAVASIGLALRAGLAHGERHRRFTSAVTHELRTPLTTFRLYSEMLASDMVPADARAGYLATLEAEAARMARLVENVLAYARLEDGRGPQALEALTLGALVERARPVLERRCAADDATLVLDLAGHEGLALATDPDAVGQVLANLVDNACKYGCPAPGATVRLSAVAQPGSVELHVRDEGPGVPPALARRVFRPFERAGRDESDPAPGVGLGLALSRDLARRLGGELGLASGGPGATFRLRLPLGPA
jgi:signal transduction histidine kinase